MTVITWRDAYRAVVASPLVSGLAILSLTLGIGANTALFSIVNSLLLKSLPVREPANLAQLIGGSWTNPIWEGIRAREGELFDGAFAWSVERFDLSDSGETDLVDGSYVSGQFFSVLGIPAIRGRMLTPGDDARRGGPDGAVAVISHRLWQRRFGGAQDVVGRRLLVQRVPFTVVGVAPPGFLGPDVGRACDVYLPIGNEAIVRGAESFLDGRATWWLEIMVRRKAGQSLEQATAALRGIQPQVRDATIPPEFPVAARSRYLSEGWTLTSAATGRSDLRGRYERPLLAILVVVGLVLLIACANLANLMLARAAARRRELSIRLALGASGGQLVRQLLAESVLLATIGAAGGAVVALFGSRVLVRQLTTWRSDVFLDLTLDWRVFAFTAGLAGLTALIVGLAPAMTALRVTPNEVLKAAGRGVMGDRRFGVRGAFVVVQMALSIVLLVAAGLFLRTFSSLNRVPLGFAPESMLLMEVNLQRSTAPPESRSALVDALAAAVNATAGVRSTAASVITPLNGSGWNTSIGSDPLPSRDRLSWVNGITPGWFTTYGMHLLAGRDLDARDNLGAPKVTIVNETFARRFLNGAPPVGQTFRAGETTYQVVGYVNDALYRSLREGPVPTMYVPLAQRANLPARVTFAMDIAPGQRPAVMRAIATALKSVDARASLTFRTFDDLLGALVVQERLVALLSGLFGAVALLLAAVGLYGVMSYSVNRRRTEIGVRLALGARPSVILRLVLSRVGLLQAAGVVIGAVISLWASRYVSTLLFSIDARDLTTLVSAVAVLVVVGGLAAWLPARRAAKLDPATVLRDS